MAVRAGQAVSAIVHAGAGVLAVSLLAGWGYGGDEKRLARDWRWLLAQPFGEWLVGAVGLAVIGAGLGMAGKAWTASLARHSACAPDQERWVAPLGWTRPKRASAMPKLRSEKLNPIRPATRPRSPRRPAMGNAREPDIGPPHEHGGHDGRAGAAVAVGDLASR
jgi:Domain of Unknown Function (DUF1206)